MKPMVALSALLSAAGAQHLLPYGLPYAAPAPAPYVYTAPAAAVTVKAAEEKPLVYAAPAPAPAIPYAPSSQFQAQDEFGNVNYGYQNINSQKHEIGNAHSGVAGAYSYVDANGELQRVEYIADALGFRVKATNLPVAPEVPAVKAADLPVAPVFEGKAPVFDGQAPAPVEKTAEVLEAEAAFFKKFEEAKQRTRRSTLIAAPFGYSFSPYSYAHAHAHAYAAPAPAVAYAGLAPVDAKTPAATVKAVPAVHTVAAAPAPAFTYAAAPVAYAAPAPALAPAAAIGREAVLTKIQLNPGHAVAYRVD